MLNGDGCASPEAATRVTTETAPLRIAWFGPIPTDGGGVSGVACDILGGLLALGHTVDCYLAGQAQPLPEALSCFPALTLHWSGSAWRWHRWYSRDPVAAFVTGTVSRALGIRRLGRGLVAHHKSQPYDVIYQFSTIEIFGFRRHLGALPPLVLHPETHMAGELRWVRRERGLSARCAPLHRRLLVRLALQVRGLVQRRDIQKASAVICISRCFRDHLVADYGISEARTAIIPNPIRLQRFTPASGAPKRPGLKVLFVGRIAVRKGVDTVIDLSHRLQDLQGGLRMELIGECSLWSDYRGLLVDLNPAVATYLGPVPGPEVADHLRSADLLIQPSKYEPFGLTVGEALAAGLPVVVTDEVGSAEGVDAACCAVVPVGDAEAFEAAMRTMLAALRGPEGPALRRIARDEAERLFDPSEVSKRVSDVLTAIAGDAPTVGRGREQAKTRRRLANPRLAVLSVQARVGQLFKPLLFSPDVVTRSIRFGPAKGVLFNLTRRTGIQREFGLYETELHSVFAQSAAAARVIYDVGASTGYTTLLLGNLAAHASVVSFEPDPASLALLQHNLELNPSIASRVKVVAGAVGEQTVAQADGRSGQVAIDDLVLEGQIAPPHLIKIDVDGGELEVLRGATQTLRDHRPVLVMETHSIELEKGCAALLSASGYAVSIIKNARWRLLWPEFRPINHNRWLVARPLDAVSTSDAPVGPVRSTR